MPILKQSWTHAKESVITLDHVKIKDSCSNMCAFTFFTYVLIMQLDNLMFSPVF